MPAARARWPLGFRSRGYGDEAGAAGWGAAGAGAGTESGFGASAGGAFLVAFTRVPSLALPCR